MRKLTVKNFSVIKEAELEFGKITVLIGPQSSGKSLLCKLAYFFQKVVIEIAENAIRDGANFEKFTLRIATEFHDQWFPAFGKEKTGSVEYDDGSYRVSIRRRNDNGFIFGDVELSPKIGECYRTIFNELKQDGVNTDFKYHARHVGSQLKDLQSPDSDVYTYIPATRSFFVTQQRAILGTSNRIDPITVQFSQDFSFSYANRTSKVGLDSDLAHWIDQESRSILRGEIFVQGSDEEFHSTDGSKVPLSFLSSGTQELLPLITCLREFTASSSGISKLLDLPQALHKRLFFVEEPEANIFPSSQYDIVRIFARMAKEPKLDASWVITTHSPYILSSFNNLLEAWQVGHVDEERGKATRKVIDEKYWVNPAEFRAYSIKDGYLDSIMDEETHLISDNFLDSVSERIGGEFDQLLRIGYVEA